MCNTWSEETWILADKPRMYTARKSVITRKRQNKKKRLVVTSDLSDDNTVDGSTTHRAILPGIGPIKVAATQMLNASQV